MQPKTDPAVTHLRLVVRVAQDVIRQERFDTLADLAEAVKCRCARLRIAYDSGVISAAVDQLDRGGRQPLVQQPRVTEPVATEGERPLTRADVADVLERLRERLKVKVEVQSVPRARAATHDELARSAHAHDRVRALQVVLDAITETTARCDALERDVDGSDA